MYGIHVMKLSLSKLAEFSAPTSNNAISSAYDASNNFSPCTTAWFLPDGILASPTWGPQGKCYTDNPDLEKDAAIPSLYAELGCVACNCYLCGKHLYNCSAPQPRQFPSIKLLGEEKGSVCLVEPSCVAILLPFCSQKAMDGTWRLMRSSIRARADVWFSQECKAGLPQTVATGQRLSLSIGGPLDRSFWGQGDCCALLVVHGYQFNPRKWANEELISSIRLLLGFRCDYCFDTAIENVTEWATCEFVPFSSLESWYEHRKVVLGLCPRGCVDIPRS